MDYNVLSDMKLFYYLIELFKINELKFITFSLSAIY